MTRLPQPDVGIWPHMGTPAVVTIANGTFALAVFKQPKAGVIFQYREAVPVQSRHLYGLPNGTWMIDHIDDYNPDEGFPLQHLKADCIDT